MPRVAHVIKAVGIAGAERHLLILLAGLRARGWDARLFLLHEPHKPLDDFAALLDERGIPLRRVVIHRHVDPGLISRLSAALREFQPQIAHTHLLHADLYGALAAKRAGVPRIVSSRHNDDAFRRRLPVRAVNRALWRVTDAGIGISEAITQFCITVEGAPPGKMRTIHYGLELPVPPLDRSAEERRLRAELSLPRESVLVGTVGRLIAQKGIVYALRAFAALKDRYPLAHLVIVGDGVLRRALETEAAQLGLNGRAHFLGWRTDVPQIMAGLDVLLMPSLWEGFGLVLLEAMARRVPIIGSAVSAIPEIVADGETGLLVPPQNVDALAEALDRLLQDAALRRHMGLLGEERLERLFNAERMVAETIAVYGALVQN